MEDYPRTAADFEARFRSEQACREYLFQIRWPEGFRCPRCGSAKAWPLRSVLRQCAGCGRQVSLTAGTIFQDTHTPLTVWFQAMWWVTAQKNGVSALGLQRVLGLGSYQTAWAWLHKLRRAMVRPGRERLAGTVEVDETFLGGLEEGVRGRGTEKKALIVVAAQEEGRCRTHPPAANSRCLGRESYSLHRGFGGTGKRDPHRRLAWIRALEKKGYGHAITYLRGREESPSELMPRVHLVVSLLKRWLIGTHQGAVSHKHLDYYLDEFTFRFNRRRSRSRGKLFFRLVQQAVAVEPTTYASVVRNTEAKLQPVGVT